MLIRDTGSTIEFWLKAGSQTFANQMPWAYVINGQASGWLQFRFASGGAWQKLASWSVTTTQTVTFKIGATGTSGLGGPTDFSVFIQRSTVPPAPTSFQVFAVTEESISGRFNSNGDGQSPILEWQVGYGPDPNGPIFTTPSNGTSVIGNLARGTTYYFWTRGRNALGWGPWSARTSATTWNYPPAPSVVTISDITQTSVHAVFNGNGDGGTPILEWRIGYGMNPGGPDLFITSTGTSDIANLSPGQKYYFWSQGRNAAGWGALSPPTIATLIAGAYVKVGPVHKRAVPYVNVNGVWKLVVLSSKIGGVWKDTT